MSQHRPLPENRYQPCPAWLPGGHAQTVAGACLVRTPTISFIRQRVNTPDDDFLDFDWTQPPETLVSSSLRALLLFHGLEGSSQSPYAQAIARFFHQRGWVVVVAHFRGCSGEPNRLVRAYHSGDAAEIDFMVKTVRQKLPAARWHLAGVSLGGNAMLCYLAGSAASLDGLHACAAISSPMDLVACGRYLSHSLVGRHVYTRQFFKTIKPKIAAKARRFPEAFETQRVVASTTLLEFDDAYTAPIHGFKNVMDYWTRASSRPVLGSLKIPTLILNAKNDPFVPAWSLPLAHEVSNNTVLHQPAQGGHVGFVTGPWPGNMTWLPQRLETFFRTAE